MGRFAAWRRRSMVARTSGLGVAIVMLRVAVTLRSQVNCQNQFQSASAHATAVMVSRRAHTMLQGAVVGDTFTVLSRSLGTEVASFD
jgi:hypothetical protein